MCQEKIMSYSKKSAIWFNQAVWKVSLEKTEYALAKMIGRRADGRGLVGVFRDGLDVVLPITEEGGTSS